ncbi:DELTA-stichotoxin-Hcr4a-like [Huso huso]|uniref:DELTA-stichotoxin-Hcr4a-like n=1 Tax=Huso huso TaxID=61971 RepID=A0ABR0YF74_HUSHU
MTVTECTLLELRVPSKQGQVHRYSSSTDLGLLDTVPLYDHCNDVLFFIRIYTFSGYNLNPPQPTIKKESTAVCSFSKTSYTARGSVGVLTYDVIKNNDAVECIAMMFSVPFDYNWYKNWFAIGSFSVGKTCDHALYNRMYHKGEDGFIRRQATDGIVEFTGKAVVIKATMSAAGRSIMKIEVWNKRTCA